MDAAVLGDRLLEVTQMPSRAQVAWLRSAGRERVRKYVALWGASARGCQIEGKVSQLLSLLTTWAAYGCHSSHKGLRHYASHVYIHMTFLLQSLCAKGKISNLYCVCRNVSLSRSAVHARDFFYWAVPAVDSYSPVRRLVSCNHCLHSCAHGSALCWGGKGWFEERCRLCRWPGRSWFDLQGSTRMWRLHLHLAALSLCRWWLQRSQCTLWGLCSRLCISQLLSFTFRLHLCQLKVGLLTFCNDLFWYHSRPLM